MREIACGYSVHVGLGNVAQASELHVHVHVQLICSVRCINSFHRTLLLRNSPMLLVRYESRLECPRSSSCIALKVAFKCIEPLSGK